MIANAAMMGWSPSELLASTHTDYLTACRAVGAQRSGARYSSRDSDERGRALVREMRRQRRYARFH